ncbi:hypothetical protein AVEN_154427-1 [Araneus ventricosus]|uniref:Pre-C2HC domain-containing protein n=1 Tax=Araneus ventricosus TaxID=182803 RepID=A0A4Y2HYN3_ARAVE|nr:hypothetical protein AVEN_154427-1 [Araneus ventricosus]
MATISNNMFYKSAKTLNELVMRLGNQTYAQISILIANAEKPKKMPQTNPFLIQDFVKKKSVSRHEQIENMKHTQQSKILFTTKDPICAVQLLSLEKFMGINISTDIIWENASARFLIFDIPTSTPLEELAAEIEDKNDCFVVEMRRFPKQNSPKEMSPVLITILDTTVPEAIKIWFIHQRLQKFIDRPRQCNKCFSFMHPSRICDKTVICYLCGVVHIGPCQQPEKCINCNGTHNAKSTSCPSYIAEQKILELKCQNHITTGEARRIFQQNKAKYSEMVKTMPAVTNIEDIINAKFETLLQAINDRFERQMAIFADMLQKSMDCICQNFCKIITQYVDPGSSPVRKKKLFSNLRQKCPAPSLLGMRGVHRMQKTCLSANVFCFCPQFWGFFFNFSLVHRHFCISYSLDPFSVVLSHAFSVVVFV